VIIYRYMYLMYTTLISRKNVLIFFIFLRRLDLNLESSDETLKI